MNKVTCLKDNTLTINGLCCNLPLIQLKTFEYLSPVLWAAFFSCKDALQQHVLHAVPCPVEELCQAEPGTLAIRLRGKRDPRGHVVLVTQERSHKKKVAVAELGPAEGVVIAEGDGWEGHVVGIALIQQGDVVILQVVDDPVTHLEQEEAEGSHEAKSPETLPHPVLLVLYKDVIGTMEGTTAKEGCQANVCFLYLFWLFINFQLIALFFALSRVTLAQPRHPSVVVIEAVFVRPSDRVVVGCERDGACNSHHD